MKEKCPRCRSTSFAVVRDMTSRRICECGFSWECPKQQITDWEVGQELIAIQDFMGERSADFKLSHNEVWQMIDKMRREIGDKFNSMGTHAFGLYSNEKATP